MSRSLRVARWNQEASKNTSFDALVVTLGYERRSRFIAESCSVDATDKVAIGFSEGRRFSYRANHRWFAKHNYQIEEVNDDRFRTEIAKLLKTQSGVGRPLRWCIDISSMSRLRIASLVAELDRAPTEVTVDFLYATAKFVSPTKEMSQIETAGPVLDDFAGWSPDPEKPSAVVFGLGYEYDKAIGALDFIEPGEIWACQPVSSDTRYDKESTKANSFLWGEIPKNRRIPYRVDSPFETFVDLESLVHGVSRDSRPILVPFGPKVFSLCCLLVALIHRPCIAVWRITSGSYDEPIDRVADGSVAGITVTFHATTTAACSSNEGSPCQAV